MNRIRIIVADDHSLFRQSIAHTLGSQEDMEVVGQAADGSEAIALTEAVKPDLLLLDINMPGMSSFDAVREIRKSMPGVKIVFLSMHDDEDYLIEGMSAGVNGYILKDSDLKHFVEGIREVIVGGNYLSPRMLTRLMDDVRVNPATGAARGRHETLSGRERQVLKILAEGKSVKQIAGDFNLSVKTIEAHKFNLMRKLGIHNKAQLVQYAIAKKIVKIH